MINKAYSWLHDAELTLKKEVPAGSWLRAQVLLRYREQVDFVSLHLRSEEPRSGIIWDLT